MKSYDRPLHGVIDQDSSPHSYPIPLLNKNKATIVFDKRPTNKSDLDKIKQWIDIFGESLIEDEDTEN